jgi:hypothetical protein
MSKNSQVVRGVLTIYFLIFSYAIYWEAKLPYRVTTDERLVFGDIHYTYTNGVLPSAAEYPNGVGFTVIETVVLRVVGGSIWDTVIIDRFISIHTIMLFLAVFLALYRSEVPANKVSYYDVLVLGILASSFFIFAGFINRLFESTHISYTYALFALAIWSSFRINTGTKDSVRILLPFILFAIGFYNFIWAMVFSGILVPAVLLSEKSSKLIISSTLSIISPLLFPIYFDNVTFPIYYIAERSLNAEFSTQTITEASSQTTDWPSVSMSYVGEFNVWILYVSGIAFVALLTMFANIHILYNLMSKKKISQISYYLLFLCFGFGALAGIFIFTEDLATLKRVLAIPGLFGVLYWVVHIMKLNNKNVIRYCLALLLLSSLLFSGLASNRSMLNGEPKPYDNYVSESEIDSLNWMHNYSNLEESECLISDNPNHFYTTRKEFGYQIPRNYGKYPTGTNEALVYKNEQSSVSWVC